MKFLLVESAAYALTDMLRDLGHDVTAIAHDYPRSIKDGDVLAIARREKRILITNDRDFGELVFLRRLPHAGIILFRLGNENVPTKTAWLRSLLTDFAGQLDHFIVVTERGVRVRRP